MIRVQIYLYFGSTKEVLRLSKDQLGNQTQARVQPSWEGDEKVSNRLGWLGMEFG